MRKRKSHADESVPVPRAAGEKGAVSIRTRALGLEPGVEMFTRDSGPPCVVTARQGCAGGTVHVL